MKNKIVLVPFPFDGLSATKVRPALCLTNTISHYDHVVIAFITSQISKATEKSDLPLLQTDTDFSQTGLKIDSAIRLHRLVTVPMTLIKRQLGTLAVSYQTELDEKIRDLFELH